RRQRRSRRLASARARGPLCGSKPPPQRAARRRQAPAGSFPPRTPALRSFGLDPPDDDELTGLCFRNDRAVADAEVEDPAELLLFDVTCEPVEDLWAFPGIPLDPRCQARREYPREVSENAAAGHVGEGAHVGLRP